MKVICNDEISDSAYAGVLKSLLINFKCWDDRLSFNSFRRIIKNNKVNLGTDSFEKTIELFGALTDDTECEISLHWITRNKDEFLSNTDFIFVPVLTMPFLKKCSQGYVDRLISA